jgi:hypothetical protein
MNQVLGDRVLSENVRARLREVWIVFDPFHGAGLFRAWSL